MRFAPVGGALGMSYGEEEAAAAAEEAQDQA
jgi:hypothetical protein